MEELAAQQTAPPALRWFYLRMPRLPDVAPSAAAPPDAVLSARRTESANIRGKTMRGSPGTGPGLPGGSPHRAWQTACRWSGPCGLGKQAPERVAGVDLMAGLLAVAGEHRLRVYFLGARREVVTARHWSADRSQHPGLEIAGFRDGYFGPDDHLNIAEEIRASGAHMLFVGMPTPFKETSGASATAVVSPRRAVDYGRGRPSTCWPASFSAPLGGHSRGAGVVLAAPDGARKLWKRYLTTNSEFIWLAGREILARRLARPPATENVA